MKHPLHTHMCLPQGRDVRETKDEDEEGEMRGESVGGEGEVGPAGKKEDIFLLSETDHTVILFRLGCLILLPLLVLSVFFSFLSISTCSLWERGS
jgi:hypothetical protein